MAYARKWSNKDISIKLRNLAKIIPQETITIQIRLASYITDDVTDAMNIAYYNLKDKCSKVKRWRLGTINSVNYKSRMPTYLNSQPSFDYSSYALSEYGSYVLSDLYSVLGNANTCWTSATTNLYA